jgi:hypothetical protein
MANPGTWYKIGLKYSLWQQINHRKFAETHRNSLTLTNFKILEFKNIWH